MIEQQRTIIMVGNSGRVFGTFIALFMVAFFVQVAPALVIVPVLAIPFIWKPFLIQGEGSSVELVHFPLFSKQTIQARDITNIEFGHRWYEIRGSASIRVTTIDAKTQKITGTTGRMSWNPREIELWGESTGNPRFLFVGTKKLLSFLAFRLEREINTDDAALWGVQDLKIPETDNG